MITNATSLVLSAIVLSFILQIPVCAFQQPADEYYDYKLIEIRKNIFVTKRTEPLRNYVEGNVVIIINKEGVLVVDATGSPHAARLIINDIKKLTDKPVTHLIITHFHGDHTFGNQAFLDAYPAIKILASKPTFEVMDKRVKTFIPFTLNDSLFKERIMQTEQELETVEKSNNPNPQVIANLKRHRDHDLYTVKKIYAEIKITPPNTIVEDTVEINDGSRKILACYLGEGDTPGDLWVFLPKEKILISGDAVVYPVPYGFSKTPLVWLETLKKAVAIDFKILITGHGNIQSGKTYIFQLITMLSSLKKQLTGLILKGKTLEECREQINIQKLEKKFTHNDPFVEYYFNQYFKEPIIRNMYDEIKKSSH